MRTATNSRLQARPDTQSDLSVFDVTKRLPYTLRSEDLRPKKSSSEVLRSRNMNYERRTSPRLATSVSVFPNTSIWESSTTQPLVSTEWISMLACKTHLHHPHLTTFVVQAQGQKVAEYEDLNKSGGNCKETMLTICVQDKTRCPSCPTKTSPEARRPIPQS